MEVAKEIAKGYKRIELSELQEELHRAYKESGKSYVGLAYELKLKSVTSIQNLLTTDPQVVSDEMLTKFINLLGLNAFVTWKNGERNYYIKN